MILQVKHSPQAVKADDFTETVKEATAFPALMGIQKEYSHTHCTIPDVFQQLIWPKINTFSI